MGKVGMTFRLTMESPEVDLEKVKAAVKEMGAEEDMREEPLGFGLMSLIVLFVQEDSEGGDTDAMEERLIGIDGVQSAKTEDVTLI